MFQHPITLKILGAAFSALTLIGTNAQAQDFPSKPIRLVVPFSPGGGNDTLAREVAPRLAEKLGQPVVVENKPGAGGNIGADIVAKAPSDGYTLLMASNQVVINPSLYSNMSFDVLRDLKPIGFIADVQFALVAHPSVKANSVTELIQQAKAQPLHHGTPGTGTPQHLAAEAFNRMTDVKLIHIPYRGTGPMTADLVGGQIELSFATLPSVEAYIKSGRLKALGVTGKKRSPLLPDVPTVAEAGVKGYDVSTWYGLLIPRNTPAAASQKLEAALQEVMGQPDMRNSIATKGFEPRFVTAKDADQLMRNDFEAWAAIIKDAQLKIE